LRHTTPAVAATSESQANEPLLQRWKCQCAYDGAAFAGWQSQPGGRAIQDIIEAQLAAIFSGLVRIHGSGRTDAGVHARGQVFHFDAAWRHGPEKLRLALQKCLPDTIQIKSVQATAPTFHARFSARRKIYRYFIFLGEADPFMVRYAWSISRKLDLVAMEKAAHLLRGKHDFRAFSALSGPEREDTVRDLRGLDFVRRGRKLYITAEAEGFLYKMVRSLVGAIVAVGDGKITLPQLKELLESRQRTPAIKTAPPHGLFLMKVLY
jgi:tRNA pseudouridine38-40 synthase